MSYRRAWLLIDDLNTSFTGRLVAAKAGGTAGGHATLTPLGRQVLTLYREAEAAAGELPTLGQLDRLAAPEAPGAAAEQEREDA